MTSFKGRHVWIIGASSGIGHALALELAARGALLTVSGRNASALEGLVQSIGPGHQAIAADVTKPETLAAALQKQPVVDSVIFMAGTYEPLSVDRITADVARQVIETNLMGAFHTIEAVLPVFRKQGHGQIALCSSVAAYRGLPNGQPYCASKAALTSLAESLRAEQTDDRIDVRLISPGFVDTPLTRKNTFAMPALLTPEKAATYIADGLEGTRFEIHFPKRFSYFMKLLRILPAWLYFRIVQKK